MDENLQKLYSPSQWSKRMAPDKIVDAHLDYMRISTNQAFIVMFFFVSRASFKQCINI